jgi:hypothetical protein
VAALGEAVLASLKWLETAITFDRKDHPNHIPQPGCFPLVVDPIIVRPACLESSWMAGAASTSSM